VGDIVTFRQDYGLERTWVPKADEDYWIAFWGRGGVPAARWKDYLRWGRRFYPPPGEDVIRGRVMSPRPPRRRTNYRRWHAPDTGD
jgi:hypothetical protein